MPNDAKFALILGIALVILIAVIFFRKVEDEKDRSPANPPAFSAGAPLPTSKKSERNSSPNIKTRKVGLPINPRSPVHKHTVQEGESLFSLAKFYYKDETRFVEIYESNKEKLPHPDDLTPGTVLIIPHVGSPPTDKKDFPEAEITEVGISDESLLPESSPVIP